MPFATDVFAGYPLLDKIRETRTGVFYHSRHPSDRTPVVLHVLQVRNVSTVNMALFREEFKAIMESKAAGMVRCWDIVESKGRLALVYDDFPGVPLSKLLETQPVNLDFFFEIAVSLADTLGQLHQEDLVHQAVRPANILVDMGTGRVRLTGFGAVSLLTGDLDDVHDPEVLAQTLPYISPEQTGRMNRPVDYRTDLYSLGITFYHMLTGQRPFDRAEPMEIIHSHIAKTAAPLRDLRNDIPGVLSDMVMRLIRKTPEERYQNSFGLKADLDICAQSLSETGTIPDFDIGRKDVSKRFNIPPRLFGREAEIETLFSGFEQVRQGKKIIPMIAGPPGVGKTALTQELNLPIVESNGFFISGKYEQFRKDVPYSAIIQALIGQIRDILKESRKAIESWREIIRSSLSPNGRVITDVIPDLALIIGDQPEVPELKSEEARNRFNYVFENFIRTMARPEKPVVMFLDDLQWADPPSLELLERLGADPTIRNLYLIGAYRDTEVSASHPLMQVLDRIAKSGTRVDIMTLTPLLEYDIRNLIVSFLKSSHEQGALLAALVHKKTGGNPFFVNQFLKNLFEKKMITYDRDQGWTWDNDRLSALQVTDNLVDLLVEKIKTLSPETRDLLKVCACIGNRFEPDMIALMLDRPVERIVPAIFEAVHAGLIGKTPTYYVFVHDRIQEAAYSLIPDDEKPLYHYRVGHHEWKRSDGEGLRNKLFYIVDQIITGMENLEDGDRNEFIHLCLRAGEKAKLSVAYDAAVNYLKTGLGLLPEDSWNTDYEMTYALHRVLIECLYLTQAYAEAEEVFTLTQSRARSNIDIANVSSLMVILYTSQGDYEKALETGYHASRLIGIPLPESSSDLKVALSLLRLWFLFRKTKIEDIPDLPGIQNPEVLSSAYLISYTGTVIYYSNPNLFALTVCDGNRISLTHGNWEYTDFGLNALGCILGSSLGMFKTGYRLGLASLTLCERKPGRVNRCRINFLFGMMILPWTRPAAESLDYFRKAYTYGLECGDILFASHSVNLLGMYRILLGHPTDDVLEEYQSYHAFMTGNKDPFVKKNYEENTRVLLCLKGLTPEPGRLDGDGFSEKERLEDYNSENNLLGRFYLFTNLIRLRYVFGRYEEAHAISLRLSRLVKAKVGLGCMHNADIVMFESLTLIALYPKAGTMDKLRTMAKVRLNQLKMKPWVKHAPENFLHKSLLVEAEVYRVKRKFLKAYITYRKAAAAAAESGFHNDEALVYQCMGLLYRSVNYMDLASFYMTEACLCYQRMQASAYAGYLRSAFPNLIREGAFAKDTAVHGGVLDLDTVIKASQAISGEINLSKLLASMLKTTLENAGAQRGFLILNQDNRLTVEAEAGSDVSGDTVTGSIPMDRHGGLCQSIVHYTARMKTPLILNHAAKTGDFTRDPYVIKHQTKSVLCLPLLNQGRLSALIYFENNLAPNAFKKDRIELLRILASQAAIAIDNARLYENLEEKVKVRTQELNLSLAKEEAANQRTMAGIRYSSLIQRSLLPDDDLVRSCLPDSFVIWQPREIIGGDIYFVEPTPDGFVLVVTDCTGHGVPGAFMTIMAVNGLRQIIHEDNELNPAAILSKLNRYVRHSLGKNRTQGQTDDGMDAAVCRVRKDSRQLDFAGARLSLYAVKDNAFTEIRGDKESLGYQSSDPEFAFTLHTLPADGQVFYLATDGFSDQLGGARSRRFGAKAFRNLLLAHHTKPFDEQKELLLHALNRHKGMESPTDDITVMAFSL